MIVYEFLNLDQPDFGVFLELLGKMCIFISHHHCVYFSVFVSNFYFDNISNYLVIKENKDYRLLLTSFLHNRYWFIAKFFSLLQNENGSNVF